MVGLGGGSTYLALLALSSLPYEAIPQIALFCNLVVVTGGFWLFYKAGYFSLRRVLPFMVTSIPMALWGGSIRIGRPLFTLLLGLSLLVASARLLWADRTLEARIPLSWNHAWKIGLPVGALLGFLSGLVGIGGGIYLSPLLLLAGWGNSKEAAAASSFFIFFNSVAGLIGQVTKNGWVETSSLFWLLLAALAGGQIGSRLGARHLPKMLVQRGTALLILIISLRLLWKV